MAKVKLCFVVEQEQLATVMNLMRGISNTATIEGVSDQPAFEQQILGTVAAHKTKRAPKAAAPETVRKSPAPAAEGSKVEQATALLKRHGGAMLPKDFHNAFVGNGDRRSAYNVVAYMKANGIARMAKGKLTLK